MVGTYVLLHRRRLGAVQVTERRPAVRPLLYGCGIVDRKVCFLSASSAPSLQIKPKDKSRDHGRNPTQGATYDCADMVVVFLCGICFFCT